MSHSPNCRKKANSGRKKITQWTRYLTLVLSLVQSFGIATALQHNGELRAEPRRRLHPDDDPYAYHR